MVHHDDSNYLLNKQITMLFAMRTIKIAQPFINIKYCVSAVLKCSESNRIDFKLNKIWQWWTIRFTRNLKISERCIIGSLKQKKKTMMFGRSNWNNINYCKIRFVNRAENCSILLPQIENCNIFITFNCISNRNFEDLLHQTIYCIDQFLF